MEDVSGFGLSATIVALQTFPMGFTVTQFADDADPIQVSDDEPTGYELLFDGTLFAYDKASAVPVSISVIPGTQDDLNLKMLLQSRKGTAKLIPVADVTSMVVSYPNGGKVVFSGGTIVSGPPGDSVTQAGRKKGNTYKFVFGTTANAQSTRNIISSVAQGIAGLF